MKYYVADEQGQTGPFGGGYYQASDFMQSYDANRHDPDSVGFDDSYTGPSEPVLGGGCNRCGCPDDCLCEED